LRQISNPNNWQKTGNINAKKSAPNNIPQHPELSSSVNIFTCSPHAKHYTKSSSVLREIAVNDGADCFCGALSSEKDLLFFFIKIL
jgi:hypothetical protein